ncbi:MAG: archaemetzincin [Pyrinomonadaceae bacterium]
MGALFLVSCSASEDKPPSNAAREAKKEIQELRAAMKKVEPFFEPMGKPEAYDWLGSHTEPGQTFDEYLDSDPTKPTKERQKIYVLPLGAFTPQQKEIIATTAGYLAAFYDLEVETMPNRALPQKLEKKDTRYNEFLRTRQVRTGFIMDSILKPMLPDDAAALIAFTNEDLFPDDTMSFVFGQASMEHRVGVWSLARLEFKAKLSTFLLRTLKIAAHETGHMFSMRHCAKYECVMSGTNHIGETDRRPIDACPECTPKICWLSDIAAAERYKKLAEFCRKNSLLKEAREFERKIKAVS